MVKASTPSGGGGGGGTPKTGVGWTSTQTPTGQDAYLIGDNGEHWAETSGLSTQIAFDVTPSMKLKGFFMNQDSKNGYMNPHSYLTDPNTGGTLWNGSLRLDPLKPAIFVLTVALRFFPLMLREINLVKESAYGRGAVRWKGFFRHPYRTFRALFIPIVIRSLKRADSLAVAATVRGFGAPVSRTSLYTLCIGWKDYLFLSVVPGISLSFLLFDIWIAG